MSPLLMCVDEMPSPVLPSALTHQPMPHPQVSSPGHDGGEPPAWTPSTSLPSLGTHFWTRGIMGPSSKDAGKETCSCGLLGCPARCLARPPATSPRGHGAVQEGKRKDLPGRKGRTEEKSLFSQQRDVTLGEQQCVSRNYLKKGQNSSDHVCPQQNPALMLVAQWWALTSASPPSKEISGVVLSGFCIMSGAEKAEK